MPLQPVQPWSGDSPRQHCPALSEQARRMGAEIGRRADMLVGRQRRQYSQARQAEIDRLQAECRVLRGLADRTEV